MEVTWAIGGMKGWGLCDFSWRGVLCCGKDQLLRGQQSQFPLQRANLPWSSGTSLCNVSCPALQRVDVAQLKGTLLAQYDDCWAGEGTCSPGAERAAPSLPV